MGLRGKRAAAAAGTVVIAAAVNVATGMLTQHWALGWFAFTIVLVVIGAAVQAWLTAAESPRGATDMTPKTGQSHVGLIAGVVVMVAVVTGVIAAALTSNDNAPSRNSGAPTAGTDVSSRPGTVDNTPSPAEPAQSPSSPSHLRHTGTLTLNMGYAADLDSTNPNWNIALQGTSDAEGSDLTVATNTGDDSGGEVSDQYNASLAITDGPPTYATCEAITDYGAILTTGNTHTGTRICVRTTEARFALLKVKELRTNQGGITGITFDVTVWDSSRPATASP